MTDIASHASATDTVLKTFGQVLLTCFYVVLYFSMPFLEEICMFRFACRNLGNLCAAILAYPCLCLFDVHLTILWALTGKLKGVKEPKLV